MEPQAPAQIEEKNCCWFRLDGIHWDTGACKVHGPSLFLFYINDIPVGLDSTIRLFADDTIAYLTITSNKDCLTLQKDLDKLGTWENKWKMAFHPDKCNVLSISTVKVKTLLNLTTAYMAKYSNRLPAQNI